VAQRKERGGRGSADLRRAVAAARCSARPARRQGDPHHHRLAVFDLALLDQLPQHSFSTRTPWYPDARKFSGVLLSDLLKAVALNDYRVEIPVEDLVRHGAMIASQLDGKPIAVRDKGPLLIIYPFDDKPELRTAVHYSRAIWQLKGLELR
jgi:hypothetical protein